MRGWRLRDDGLWQNRDFLRLWAGESISFLGSQITYLALPLTAVLTLDATPSQMGWLEAVQFAPFLLFALFAGVWVDRWRKRPVMVAANLSHGLVLGLIPLLAALGALRMEHLYAVGFLTGVLQVFFQLAYQAYLPALVGREHLVQANSRMQFSVSVAQVGGPGLAGLLVEWLRAPLAIAFDALSFVAAGIAAMGMRRPEPAPAPPAAGRSIWLNIGDGLGLVLRNPYLRALMGEALTYNVCGNAISTLFLLYATRELELRPGVLGLLFTAGSVGALPGAFLAGWGFRRFGVGPSMMATYVLVCSAPLLLPLATDAGPVSLALVVVSLLVTGVTLTMSNIQVLSLRQALIPQHLYGRATAAYRVFTYGTVPVGPLAAGYLAETIGLRPALAVSVLAMLLALPWVFFSPVPRLQRLPDPAEGDPAPAAPGGPGAAAAPAAPAAPGGD